MNGNGVQGARKEGKVRGRGGVGDENMSPELSKDPSFGMRRVRRGDKGELQGKNSFFV